MGEFCVHIYVQYDYYNYVYSNVFYTSLLL